MEFLTRTESLIGKEKLNILNNSHIAVFGIGGVGSFVVEALARCGVGKFTLVDNDVVSISNINRQIIALNSTVGKDKVEVMKERILDINPTATVITKKVFYLPETANQFDFEEYDYVVDCVDTVTAKIDIIVKSKEKEKPVISSMGTGNKLDPTLFKIENISKTSVCPLARVMRKELKNRGIENLKVLYSTEKAISISENNEEFIKNKKVTPASISFVPSTAGLIIASEVVKDLTTRKY